MSKIDFSNLRIPCSSLPHIMPTGRGNKPLTAKQRETFDRLILLGENRTESQEVTYNELYTKDALSKNPAVFSQGCKTELKNIYISEKYGKRPPYVGGEMPAAVRNGTISQHEALQLWSEVANLRYSTHKDVIKGKYLKGQVDAYTGTSIKRPETIVEIKTVGSLQSLLSYVDSDEIGKDYWQAMGYLAITKADRAVIAYCLVSYPETIIEAEISRVIANAVAKKAPSDVITAKIEQVRKNMTFDEIPKNQRVVQFEFTRDDDVITQINEKAKECIAWIKQFEKKYIMLNG